MIKLWIWIKIILGGISDIRTSADGSEEWGYIPVRPGASMFYWFYKTTHADGYINRPVVLWLQGGPGSSGTGLGNFLEIGPLDQNLDSRNKSWIHSVSLLFVDSPVGVGFSKVDNISLIPDDKEKIADDLVEMLTVFMEMHPNVDKTPFYIFGQSYGGNMAVYLASALQKKINLKEINISLKGVGIGNSCLSTTDAYINRPTMLYVMSIIDHATYIKMNKTVWIAYEAGEKGNWDSIEVANGDNIADNMRSGKIPCMSVYNILDMAPVNEFSNLTLEDVLKCGEFESIYNANISKLMNEIIRKKLGIIPDDVIWKSSSVEVGQAQFKKSDFFKPAWPRVDDLLKNSDLDIVVYQGQLDVLCNTAGTLGWIRRLTWPGLSGFRSAKREALYHPDTYAPQMFTKSHEHLTMYWVLDAGHVVPADAPEAALRILEATITGT